MLMLVPQEKGGGGHLGGLPRVSGGGGELTFQILTNKEMYPHLELEDVNAC